MKNIPVATHAQCVEKSWGTRRETRRKEVFEINHLGSRQQVYVLPRDAGSCPGERTWREFHPNPSTYIAPRILFLNRQICTPRGEKYVRRADIDICPRRPWDRESQKCTKRRVDSNKTGKRYTDGLEMDRSFDK